MSNSWRGTLGSTINRGAQGAAIGGSFGGPLGAGIGAGAGALTGLLESLLGGDANDLSDEQRRLWENLAYEDPNKDPRYAQAMNQLEQWGKGGLTAADRSMMQKVLEQAGSFAGGREGAIRSDMAQRGQGGNAGMSAVLQDIAAQSAASRASDVGSSVISMADARARQANAEFARQVAANADAINRFKIMKTQGMTGALGNAQDYAERQGASTSAMIDKLANGLGTIAAANKKDAGSDYKKDNPWYDLPNTPAAQPAESYTQNNPWHALPDAPVVRSPLAPPTERMSPQGLWDWSKETESNLPRTVAMPRF